jgi:hypothetical protein
MSGAFVSNPVTGRQIRVGGATYNKLIQNGLAPRSWRSSSTNAAALNESSNARVAGAVIADLERMGYRVPAPRLHHTTARRPRAHKVAARAKIRAHFTTRQRANQKSIVARSKQSSSERIVKAAKRSLTGKYANRPSPPVSASLFTIGTPMTGNDGREWFVNPSGRWQPE